MDSGIYDKIKSSIDPGRMLCETEKLWKAEFGQQHKNYLASARTAEKILIRSGLSDVQRIAFPADGKTVYQDKTMPMCWKASVGRLEVKKAPFIFEDPVAADINRHPFHLIKGSTSTLPGGVDCKLITYEQMFAGEDARGAAVIAPPDARDKKELYSALCDFGALAMVYDWLGSRYETPDNLHWVNGWTEGPHWHALCDERPLIGFCVSPRTGDMLRNAARKGEVIVRVESDGKNFSGEIDVVTGIVPGKNKRELWLLAHLYEPLSADNSAGAACACEIARRINSLAAGGEIPRPEFTIRVVLGLEMYGFAAYADLRGGCLKDKVIGAVNLDGTAVTKQGRIDAVLPPPPSAFFGNFIARDIIEDPAINPLPGVIIDEAGMYADDTFLSDSTTGVPTVWIHQQNNFWHNSIQTMGVINEDVLGSYARLCACLAYRTACLPEADDIEKIYSAAKQKIFQSRASFLDKNPGGACRKDLEEFELSMKLRLETESAVLSSAGRLAGGALRDLADKRSLQLEHAADEALSEIRPREAPDAGQPLCRWTAIAESIVSERACVGIPYDLAGAPRAERRLLPDRIIYGPLARILSNMDGSRNLGELICRARWEMSLSPGSSHSRHTGLTPDEQIGPDEIKKYISAVEYLTRWGYLRTRYKSSTLREDISSALARCGIEAGDTVFLHSGLSVFGHIEGGADAVIDAFLDVLKNEGTLVLPTFTPRSIIYFDGSFTAHRKPRPFDPARAEDVEVGEVPRKFLKRAGVLRSFHPTHSAAALGRLSENILSAHRESDSPCGKNSPLARVLEHGGKFVFFGADLSATTFFHYLEDHMDLPYLAGALCTVKNPDGSLRAVLTPKNLPGHRDFYIRPGESSRMYKKLIEEGLDIKTERIGFGEIKVIEARQLFSLGLKVLSRDRSILLCGDPRCSFCRRGVQLLSS